MELNFKYIWKKLHLFNILKKINIKFRHIILRYKTKIVMYKSLKKLKECNTKNKEKKNILILGHIVSFDKGSCKYINKLSSVFSEYQLLLLSETPHLNTEDIKKMININNIVFPYAAYEGGYDKHISMYVSRKKKERIKEHVYLRNVIENLYTCFGDIGKGYAEILTLYYYEYYKIILGLLRPEMVIIWNKFSTMHILMNELCSEFGIKTVFMEFGVLPGTFSFDKLGQMGESYPAIFYDEFRKLEVSSDEKKEAEKVWAFLKKSKLNRNAQPKDISIDTIKENLKSERPTIFYAGQNDYESGMYPYTEHTAQYHSPIFKSSDEAAIYLALLAKKNDWNLIYKPHPIMERLNNVGDFDSNIIVVHRGNINELIDISDLTITILSQTGYISMIREKATLMMGYTQLRGKKCTYEAFEYDGIESTIKEALLNGLTDDMKDSFNTHIAQLLKYYLFDDLCERQLRFGRAIEKTAEFFESSITDFFNTV